MLPEDKHNKPQVTKQSTSVCGGVGCGADTPRAVPSQAPAHRAAADASLLHIEIPVLNNHELERTTVADQQRQRQQSFLSY